MEKEQFIKNFKEALATEKEEISIETELEEIEEWDSMGYISVMAMLDEEYDLSVTADELRGCNYLKDIFDLVKDNN